MPKDNAVTQVLDGMPAPIRAAREWFEANYNPDHVSAIARQQDGKASALIYVPNCDPNTLNLIITFVSGLHDEARR